jgi:hypothetical protein
MYQSDELGHPHHIDNSCWASTLSLYHHLSMTGMDGQVTFEQLRRTWYNW